MAISYLPAGIAVSRLIFSGLTTSSRVKHSNTPLTASSPMVLLSVKVFRLSCSCMLHLRGIGPMAAVEIDRVEARMAYGDLAILGILHHSGGRKVRLRRI